MNAETINSILRTENVYYSYENTESVLEDINIDIRKNARSVLLGANGAGKTTLFYHLNGVMKPKDGTVLYNDIPMSYRKKALIKIRTDVGVVLQNPDDQIFAPLVKSDVAFGPRNLKLSPEEIEKRVEDALDRTGLTEYKNCGTMNLSYGQRKRVSFAGILAMRPTVLIMDEPTAGLDPQMASEIMEITEQLHHNGATVLMSTHNNDLSYSWAEDSHVINNGKLIFSGEAEDFYSDEDGVQDAGLALPTLFRMNRDMAKLKGIDPEPYPRTWVQYVCKYGKVSTDTGTIHLVGVMEGFDPANHSTNVGKTGIFGELTRQHSNKLNIDFHHDAVDHCIMEALKGVDSTLFCDKNLRDLIISKIDRIGAFGRKIDIKIS